VSARAHNAGGITADAEFRFDCTVVLVETLVSDRTTRRTEALVTVAARWTGTVTSAGRPGRPRAHCSSTDHQTAAGAVSRKGTAHHSATEESLQKAGICEPTGIPIGMAHGHSQGYPEFGKRLLNKNSHLCSRLTQSTFKSLAARFEFSRPDGGIVRHLTAARELAPNLPSSENPQFTAGVGRRPAAVVRQ
jgi:hypothetical protein